jgi:hypothetical protein
MACLASAGENTNLGEQAKETMVKKDEDGKLLHDHEDK